MGLFWGMFWLFLAVFVENACFGVPILFEVFLRAVGLPVAFGFGCDCVVGYLMGEYSECCSWVNENLSLHVGCHMWRDMVRFVSFGGWVG